MKGNSKGVSFNDRQLAGEVRSLGLKKLKQILEEEHADGMTELQKAVLLRLAPSLLPRLNEHTGADGAPLFDAEASKKAEEAIRGILGAGDTEQGE